MDYDSTPVSRYSTTIRFVAIGVVLVILFIVGLILSKNMVTSMTDQPSTKTASTKNEKSDEAKQAEKEKQAASEKAQAEQAAMQAEEAKKQEEAKKAQEAAAAASAAQAAAAPQTGVASTGPSAVASTGPEDAILYTIGLASLAFAGVVFTRSRRELRRVLEQKLGTPLV